MRDSTFVTPSTATHIDSLLKEVSKRPGTHPLYQATALVSLAKDIRIAVARHAEFEDAWSPKFRSKKGHASRWEELPLVASLLTTLVLVASGNEEALARNIESVRGVTEATPGPTKTQNKTQWEYIAKVVVRILEMLEVDHAAASAVLEKRYGYSCLKVMRALAQNAAA